MSAEQDNCWPHIYWPGRDRCQRCGKRALMCEDLPNWGEIKRAAQWVKANTAPRVTD